MNSENSHEELDLIDLVKICWGWFVRFVYKPLLFLFKFGLKHIWVLVLSAILGLSTSFLLSIFNPKYVGVIVFENYVAHSSDFINDIRLLSTTTPDYKAQALNIDKEDADDIISIAPHALYYKDSMKTSYYIDMQDKAPKHSVALSNRFCVEIKAKGLDAFKDIEQGILYYFSSNDYYKRLESVRKNKLIADKEVAVNAVSKLDEMSKSYSFGTGAMLVGENMYPIMDPTTISRERFRLNDINNNTDSAMELLDGVITPISHLQINKLPTNHFVYTYKKFVILFVMLGYLISLCVVYRKKILSFVAK